MRQVLSLSLPDQATKEIKDLSKKRGFESVSGYIKYLVDLDKDLISEKELLLDVKQAEKDYEEGKGIKANSLTEALNLYGNK
ncbi:MAG: hypothetical protein V1865_01335 [bacterium]